MSEVKKVPGHAGLDSELKLQGARITSHDFSKNGLKWRSVRMELFLDVPRNAQDTSRLVFQSLEAKKMPFCSLDKSDVPMKIACFFK